jgi:hypothetical protein
VRSDGVVEVALVTTSDGPFTDDVFVELIYADDTSEMVPLDDNLLHLLQALPGFDNETVIAAMSRTDDAVSVLWRQSPID